MKSEYRVVDIVAQPGPRPPYQAAVLGRKTRMVVRGNARHYHVQMLEDLKSRNPGVKTRPASDVVRATVIGKYKVVILPPFEKPLLDAAELKAITGALAHRSQNRYQVVLAAIPFSRNLGELGKLSRSGLKALAAKLRSVQGKRP